MKSETETKPANGDIRNRIWQELNVRQEIKAQKAAVKWVYCCLCQLILPRTLLVIMHKAPHDCLHQRDRELEYLPSSFLS